MLAVIVVALSLLTAGIGEEVPTLDFATEVDFAK